MSATPHNKPELRRFEIAVSQAWPLENWANVSLLVAVSGGPDSVALLRAITNIRRQAADPSCMVGTIHVAHFNHGWRPEASDKDETFVRGLANQCSLSCHVGRSASREKKEETARSERYAFLKTTAERVGARYLVLGHNADDQAETILHRIIRGTALRGLAGIPARRPLGEAVTICRPMLWATREQVLEYLNAIQQPFQVDQSNTDLAYTRNRIRHELLPHLTQEYNSEVHSSLLKLGKLAAEANQIISEHVETHMEACVLEQTETTVILSRPALTSLPSHLRKQLLITIWRQRQWPEQSMGFVQWDQLIQAVDSGLATCLPGNIRVTTNNDAIGLTRFDS